MFATETRHRGYGRPFGLATDHMISQFGGQLFPSRQKFERPRPSMEIGVGRGRQHHGREVEWGERPRAHYVGKPRLPCRRFCGGGETFQPLRPGSPATKNREGDYPLIP